jgi:benzoate membrane transport protein
MLSRLPPLHSWSSAFLAIVVGFGGTVALVIQALRAVGASVDQTGSAVTALCLGIAIGSAALSIKIRMPIVLAWSTGGMALLATTAPSPAWPVAIAAFLASALLMIVVGLVPALGRLTERIPASIASAMLAGVLLPFCLEAFRLGTTDPVLVATLIGVFVVARQRVPLYALLFVLAASVVLTLLRDEVTAIPSGATFGALVPTLPALDARALFSLGLPLFMVTLVSQNLPGLMVLRAAGYQPNPATLLWGTGLTSLFAAPFGAPGVTLAAITASLCTNDDAHPDRGRRWTVAVIYAGMYLALAVFSPTLVRLFLALPHAVIATLTGLALIPALMGSVDNMLAVKDERDAAILTFLATGSGLALFGLGSAFWGLIIGFAALGAKTLFRRRAGDAT